VEKHRRAVICGQIVPAKSNDKPSTSNSRTTPATEPASLEVAVDSLQLDTGDADVDTDGEWPATTRQKKKKGNRRERPTKYPAPDEPYEMISDPIPTPTGVHRQPVVEPSACEKADSAS